MKRSVFATVLAAGLAFITLAMPALAQAPAPVPQPKGVKSSNLITSLGGFREEIGRASCRERVSIDV